jgi:chromate reductase, NAD(P)H dehydrogenase (quinone)
VWTVPRDAIGESSHNAGSSLPNVLALPGSLRRDSHNRRLLSSARAHARDAFSISIYDDLSTVPMFNEDLEADGGPGGVRRLGAAVACADALLIATPEYNQGIPGVVKNVLDWLSRGEPDPLAGKPVGILGATIGPWGTRLAQAALRQALTACGALVMPTPQIYLRHAADAFDSEGNLIDESTRAALTSFLASFRQWIARTMESRPTIASHTTGVYK